MADGKDQSTVSKQTRKKRGERADGRIQVTYTDGVRQDGKPNRIAFYGKTRSEAIAKREAYIAERKAGILPDGKKLTVSQWTDMWKAMYKPNADDYAPYINKLKHDLGRFGIREVQEANLVASLSTFSGKSTSGATKYRMIIKQVFHKAKKNHLIPDDPSEDLELPDNTTQGSHRALERWESDAIINGWQLHRAGRWAMIMLLAGLRRGEMAALDWEDIDLNKRIISVRKAATLRGGQTTIKDTTKTEAGQRDLPICEPLYQMLCKTPQSDRHGPVCLSAKNKRLTAHAIKKGWKTFCTYITRSLNNEEVSQQGRRTDCAQDKFQTGTQKNDKRIVFNCRPHDLRHTYATALYDAGVDLKSAQYYLGHTDITMTQELYTHLSQERKNVSRSQLLDYLDKWLEKHINEH